VVSNVVYFDVTNATSSVSFDSTNSFYAVFSFLVSVAIGDFTYSAWVSAPGIVTVRACAIRIDL
jgi:hypothetical protein